MSDFDEFGTLQFRCRLVGPPCDEFVPVAVQFNAPQLQQRFRPFELPSHPRAIQSLANYGRVPKSITRQLKPSAVMPSRASSGNQPSPLRRR